MIDDLRAPEAHCGLAAPGPSWGPQGARVFPPAGRFYSGTVWGVPYKGHEARLGGSHTPGVSVRRILRKSPLNASPEGVYDVQVRAGPRQHGAQPHCRGSPLPRPGHTRWLLPCPGPSSSYPSDRPFGHSARFPAQPPNSSEHLLSARASGTFRWITTTSPRGVPWGPQKVGSLRAPGHGWWAPLSLAPSRVSTAERRCIAVAEQECVRGPARGPSHHADRLEPPPSTDYLEGCDRSLEAANASFNAGIHEKACFLTYHAFEALGGALADSRNVKYPKSHQSKINEFQRRTRTTRHAHTIAGLAIALSSLRNLSLYPSEQPDGSATPPSSRVSKSITAEKLKQVRGVSTRLRKYI